jgi:Fur family ferric uptake transcriptional regulator
MKEYSYLLEELKKILKKKNLKFTRQREVILQTLFESDEHHTPEEILSLVKKKFPQENIGIATIYRNLAFFEENGLAESISFGKDGKKYEIGHKKHHDHLVCLECGKIIEFIDDVIEKRQEEVATKYNFKMHDHIMKIVGVCQECQNKN